MKVPVTIAGLLILSATAAACAAPRPSSDPVAGLAVAQQHCGRCHAIALDDTSSMAEAPPLRDLYRRYAIEDLRRAFLEGLQVAHPMPVFELSEREVDRLLSYLRSIDPCVQPSSDRAAMDRCFSPL